MLFPNELSQICLIAIGSLFYIQKTGSNVINYLAIIISMFVLVATLSRGSWLTITCTLFIILLINLFFTKKISILSILSFFLLFCLLILFNFFDVIIERFLNPHSDSDD